MGPSDVTFPRIAAVFPWAQILLMGVSMNRERLSSRDRDWRRLDDGIAVKQNTTSAVMRALSILCDKAEWGTAHLVAVGRGYLSRHHDWSHMPRTAGLTVLAIFFLWEVGSRSVVAYLADSAPEIALGLRPQEATALVNLADRELNGNDEEKSARPVTAGAVSTGRAETPGNAYPRESSISQDFSALKGSARNSSRGKADATDDRATLERAAHLRPTGLNTQIRMQAETALLSDPLNAKALRILGQLAAEESDKERALKFMRASARNSIHESLAVYWTMRDSVEKYDYKKASYYADALLRTRPSLMTYVAPTLVKMAENKEANGEVKRLLFDDPPWRLQFFGALAGSISDVRTPLDLLLSLRGSKNPASPAELQPYLALLVMRKFYSLAYYTWLQLLPPAQLATVGSLFNGSFEFTPSGLPFDWTITSGAGVSIDIVPRVGKPDKHALLIEFEHGRADYRSVTQMIMLAPGSYRFYGEYKSELVGPRGLKWRISCADSLAQVIGESEAIIGIIPSWKDVQFSFTVPNVECGAQYVRLDLDARMASEQLVTGSVLLDELQIERSDGPQSK
jgi:hypothetical protein